jgi:hypothetical protein
MRAGIIQVPDSSGVWRPYNLNPQPVAVDGVTYQPATCSGGPCDTRGLGLNPIVSEIWNKWMPLPNNPLGGDRYNTQGYRTSLLPQTSNFMVGQVDHDFAQNGRFMTSYRYYKFTQMRPGRWTSEGLEGNTEDTAQICGGRLLYIVTGLPG